MSAGWVNYSNVTAVNGGATPVATTMRLVTTATSYGTAGTEVVGGGYTRQVVPFSPATHRIESTASYNVLVAEKQASANVVFDNMPATTVTGFELWTAAGTRFWWANFASGISVGAGKALIIPATSVITSAVDYEWIPLSWIPSTVSATYLKGILDHCFGNTTSPFDGGVSVGLATSTVTTLNTAPTEVTGGSYARQPLTVGLCYYGNYAGFPNGQAPLTFSGLPATNISGVCTYRTSDGAWLSYGSIYHKSGYAGSDSHVLFPVTAGSSLTVATNRIFGNFAWSVGGYS